MRAEQAMQTIRRNEGNMLACVRRYLSEPKRHLLSVRAPLSCARFMCQGLLP